MVFLESVGSNVHGGDHCGKSAGWMAWVRVGLQQGGGDVGDVFLVLL